MPYLYCTVIGDLEPDNKTRDLATNYEIKVIVHDTSLPKNQTASVYCGNTALLKGKPAITIESGKLGRTDEEDVVRVITGSYNILKHLGMIPGKLDLIGEPVWVKEYTIVRAEHDGLFYPLVHRGHHVQQGELVGYLTDFFGNTIQEVKAPYNGTVLYIIATPPMSKGEPMVSVGRF
jgi:predicted deacylase